MLRSVRNIDASTTFRGNQRILAVAAVATAAALACVGLMNPLSATAETSSYVTVQQSDFAGDYATGADTNWFADVADGGVATVGVNDADGRNSLVINQVDADSSVNVFKTFGPEAYLTNLESILSNASFTFAGPNVNFQIGMFFAPNEDAYGPAGGETACTPASVAPETLCYTTLKFEPSVDAVGGYETTDLNAERQAHTGDGGWVTTQRVGTFDAHSSISIADFATQVASIKVYGVGVAVGGPAETTGISYVRNISFSGVSYSFGNPVVSEPPAPVAAPAESSEALLDSVDPDQIIADTQKVVPAEESQNGDLTKIDADAPVTITYAGWSNPADDWVDVYAYSTPTYIGTYPVINGNITITDADFTGLEGGDHHLVFQGQTSRTLSVVAFTVLLAELAVTAADPVLAETGVRYGLWLVPAGSLILLLGGATIAWSRKQRG